MTDSKPDEPRAVTDSLDTHRFHLDKRVYRIRFENETETHVDVVIEQVGVEEGIH